MLHVVCLYVWVCINLSCFECNENKSGVVRKCVVHQYNNDNYVAKYLIDQITCELDADSSAICRIQISIENVFEKMQTLQILIFSFLTPK